MSVPASEPQPLIIRGRAIRADDNGLICLNDIWTAAGFTKNMRPADWGPGRIFACLIPLISRSPSVPVSRDDTVDRA